MRTSPPLLILLSNGQLSCTAELTDFPGYTAHSDGRIYSHKLGRFLRGYINYAGYRRVKLTNAEGTSKNYRLSRIIAAAFLGPANGLYVDHINHNRSDDKVTNLRYLTPQQNQFNRAIGNGTSTVLGVCFNKQAGKWRADIRANGEAFYLGYFATEEAAALAYQTAKTKYHVLPERPAGLSQEEVNRAYTILSQAKRVEGSPTRSEPQKARL